MTKRMGWTFGGLAAGVAIATLAVAVGHAGGLWCSAQQIGRDDARLSKVAIETLRRAGPSGLETMFEQYGDVLAAGPKDARWARVTAAIDEVAAQRDAASSRLYWYTDLAAAKAAARAQGRPILSLRLLGRLDQELSCANSRYFRTALYANTALSHELREGFVLHWQSVRPAPRLTIDYGDGRRVERTVTGNSIHYVLDADGRVVDALPGLYGPQAFGRALERARRAAAEVRVLEGAARRAWLVRYYDEARTAADEARTADEERIGAALRADDAPASMLAALDEGTALATREIRISNFRPSAIAAGRRAMMKSTVEMPAIRQVVGGEREPAAIAEDASAWAAAAALHRDDGRLDASSLALMRRKLAGTDAARDDAAFARVVESFERLLAEDGLRNAYAMGPVVQGWLAGGDVDVDALNEKVYAELFLTPRSDPWLGLVPPDSYAAIERQGIQ